MMRKIEYSTVSKQLIVKLQTKKTALSRQASINWDDTYGWSEVSHGAPRFGPRRHHAGKGPVRTLQLDARRVRSHVVPQMDCALGIECRAGEAQQVRYEKVNQQNMIISLAFITGSFKHSY